MIYDTFICPHKSLLFWHKQVGIPLLKEMSASVGGHEAYRWDGGTCCYLYEEVSVEASQQIKHT